MVLEVPDDKTENSIHVSRWWDQTHPDSAEIDVSVPVFARIFA